MFAEGGHQQAVREKLVDGIDGTRLYLRWKRGPSKTTALLCDGLLCDGFIFKYLWTDLHQVVSLAHWHYPGHGRSGLPRDTERVGPGDLAQHLALIHEALDRPPLVLVGHSLGVQVVLEAWRHLSPWIRGMVLISGSFGQASFAPKAETLGAVLPVLDEWVSHHPAAARAIWSRIPRSLARKAAEIAGDVNRWRARTEDIEPYFEHATLVDPQLAIRMLEKAGHHSAADVLPSLTVPTLVMAGENDTLTAARGSAELARLIPTAELVVVPGATHVLPLEHRTLVRDRILSFLGQHLPGVDTECSPAES